MTSPSSDADLLWQPTHPEKTQSDLFRQHVNQKYGLSLNTYEELQRWTCEYRGDFWAEVWDWHDVVGTKGSGPYVDAKARPSDNPIWFEGATLNWAENQLRHATTHPDDTAVIQISEYCDGHSPEPKHFTQKELYRLVARVQAGLKKAGLGRGDRVAYWGGNCLEAVVVLLATSACGGIFSSAASDFGLDGVRERLAQIRPKVLFVTNGVVYNSAPRPLLPLLKPLLQSLENPPEVTVVIEHLPPAMVKGDAEGLLIWDGFQQENDTVEYERMGFNDPIWILFSSGTTGKPKAIVHRQGGMLLDSLREHHLAGDMSRGDIYLYYTTPGWMMFQYLVSGLATGATLVVYEGSPLRPHSVMWEWIDKLGVTLFGTSAKWIEQIAKHYPDVKEKHNLSTLRQIMSTGSPLPPQSFDFVFEHVKKDVLLGSVTGGTDICSVFAGRNTCLPVYRGEIQSRMLGFALDTEPSPGPGELVCREAFPIEPLGFWPLPGYGFPEEESQKAQGRFKESYFKDDIGNWCTAEASSAKSRSWRLVYSSRRS